MKAMTKNVMWAMVAAGAMAAGAVLSSGAGLSGGSVLRAAQPAEEPANTYTEMRQQVLAGTKFVYTKKETSFIEFGELIGPMIEKALTASGEGKMGAPAGTITFVYRGITGGDPTARFTLEVGLPVGNDGKAPEGFEMAELPPFRCASLIMTGPMSGMPEAYGRLMGEIQAAGLTPTGVNRESYLYWEGMDSRNNITHIAMGVQ